MLREDRTSSSSSLSSSSSACESLSDALLFSTMCFVGFPVDVQVKDGSVFSGIFYTACLDAHYGVVLKKARMIKKGKGNTNVGKECVVDTLVIQSDDLVQVVAKGVMLPADGIEGNVTGDDEEAVTYEVENHTGSLMDAKQDNQSRSPIQIEDGFAHGFPPPIAENEYEGKKLPVNQMRSSLEIGCKTDKTNFTKIEAASGSSNNERQARGVKSKGKADVCIRKQVTVKEKIDEKIQRLDSSHGIDTCPVLMEAVEHRSTYMTSNPSDNALFCHNDVVSVKVDDQCSDRSTSTDSASTNSSQGVVLISESHNMATKSVKISAPRGTGSTRNAKEFRLNPAAKVFSPSYVHPSSVTSGLPTTANMVYVPNSSPSVHFAAIQPEVGLSTFASRPSLPVKVAEYSNVSEGNGGSGSQFSQPFIGQLPHRTQPLRYTAHYTPALSEPAYLQPSSPAVMVGRSGQLVYVHPVSHELVHGATTISPVSARPLLNHVQLPKQQGSTVSQTIPVCAPPPVLASGQQSYALQSHIPLLQPGFPTTRPISVPGPNGFYGTKFS
ncbi:hypothetical protein RIF29_02066 [Crotalaria pallida]|uniref:Ataxin 2 SM domain-containing protein n=1 Tax=Crotalaria pallida TaxID=3830 RepID=A0AAN9IY20_CROPI